MQQDEEEAPQHQRRNEATVREGVMSPDRGGRPVRMDQRPQAFSNHSITRT